MTFPLRELLEMTLYSSVTGVLNVYWPQGSCQIYFRDGQPYHATSHKAVGVDAIAAIFEHSDAPFAFVSDLQSDEETIWGDPLDLIDRAKRLAARWRQVRTSVASMQLVPHLAIAQSDVMAHVSEEYWPVCQGIDGTRTLDDLVAELGWEPIVFAEAVAQLLAEHTITLTETPCSASGTANEAARSSAAANSKGLFDRLLANVAPADPATSEAAAEELLRPGSKPAPNASDVILRMLRS